MLVSPETPPTLRRPIRATTPRSFASVPPKIETSAAVPRQPPMELKEQCIVALTLSQVGHHKGAGDPSNKGGGAVANAATTTMYCARGPSLPRWAVVAASLLPAEASVTN